MRVKEQLLNLQAYVPGKSGEEVKVEYGLDRVVKLASNENPYGCSPKAQKAAELAISRFAVYPDGAAQHLRDAVAADKAVSPESLIFASGLDELIQMISRALLSPGTNVVMADMTFPQYRHHAVIEKAEIRIVPLKAGKHDLPAMRAAVDENTQLVWICNPNNPTGTYIDEKELVSFLKSVPSDVLVVLDEAYAEYAAADDFPDSLSLLPAYPNLLVMRTFSKAYGLAALRIGYGIGNPELIRSLEVTRLPFNTSAVAQAAAEAAIEDKAFVEESASKNRAELEKYYAFCKKHRIDFFPSEGNFIFISIPGKSSFDAAGFLLEHGWIVRPFPAGIRITVGTAEENDGLMALLEQMMLVKS